MKREIKYKIQWFLTLIIIISGLSASAQYPAAAPGKEGIFILFDKKLPIDFSYRLERKTVDDKSEWVTVHTSSMPVLSNREVYNRLLAFNSKMPFYPIPDSVVILKFINLVRGKKTTDSIYVFNAYPPYLELLGTSYFDNSVRQNIKYEYRVSKFDKKGKLIESSMVKPVSYPGEKQDFKATSYEATAWGNKINIRYNISGKSKPTGFRVFRQNYLQTSFREFHPMTSFITVRNGITMLLTDTLVVPQMIYRYVVIPYDIFGNEGQISDTVMVNNIPVFGEVPSLRDLEAISLDNELAIKIRWKSTKVANLRSISIYRSTNFDDGYTLYSKVLPTDTVFIDHSVEPITNYYYYLIFNGTYGDSPESAKVIGMVKGLREPILPPQNIKIISNPKGNIITWKQTGYDTKGYYVFRGEGFSNPGEQISDLILSDSTMVSYEDPGNSLKPGQPYCYAVKSVNKSNLLSPLSEVVIAEILRPVLPTPLNLEVRVYDGNALLIWEDMKAISSNVTGYKIWRQIYGTDDSSNIQISKSHALDVNNFIDTTLQRGISYLYYVQAEGIINSESKLSAPFEFTLQQLIPVPPAGLRATKTDQGIILSWDTPAFEGLSGFKIYQEKLGEEKRLLTTLGKDISGYTDKVIVPGTYFYTITSVSGKNEESMPCDEIGVAVE